MMRMIRRTRSVCLRASIFRTESFFSTRSALFCGKQSCNLQRETPEVLEAYKWLKQFRGGSVDLNLSYGNRIAVLTLNNPEKRNALSGSMMCDFLDVVRELEADDRCVAVLLRGQSGVFCSGGDLDFVRKTLSGSDGTRISVLMQHTLCRLNTLPQASVSLIEGAALGGGAELSTWTDWRIAEANAKIGFVQIRLGITTGWGATSRLTELIGARNALQMLVRSATMKANEAHRLGLVDVLIPASQHNVAEQQKNDAELQKLNAQHNEQFAVSWLNELYSHADTNAVRSYKRMTTRAACSSRLESLEYEREHFSRFWGAPLHVAKLNAHFKR